MSHFFNRLFRKEKDRLSLFLAKHCCQKYKRTNIFFCTFIGQVERSEQIILINNTSNRKRKTKSILNKQQQLCYHLEIFSFFPLRKISVKELLGSSICFDCMIPRNFYFWDGKNVIPLKNPSTVPAEFQWNSTGVMENYWKMTGTNGTSGIPAVHNINSP